MWEKLDADGYIPLGEECPFDNICEISKNGTCQRGNKNQTRFSCAVARGFEILGTEEIIGYDLDRG